MKCVYMKCAFYDLHITDSFQLHIPSLSDWSLLWSMVNSSGPSKSTTERSCHFVESLRRFRDREGENEGSETRKKERGGGGSLYERK